MAQLEVTWTLTLERANFILAVIGRQPLEQVLEIWSDLRQQTIASQNPQPPPQQFPRGNGEARMAQPG